MAEKMEIPTVSPYPIRSILLVAVVVGAVTGGNLWLHSDDPLLGYEIYSKFGLSFDHPRDVRLRWELGIYEDGRVDVTGTWSANESSGIVGFNARGEAVSVIWASKETNPGLDDILELYYTGIEDNERRQNREYHMLIGKTGSMVKAGHEVKYQYHNYTSKSRGSSNPTYFYGIVRGWYCEETSRAMALYYNKIFYENPICDERGLLTKFRSYLDSVQCH